MPRTPIEVRAEMIEYATGRLKGAGFVLAYTSMKTEACYYKLGERKGVVRVAAHRFSRSKDKDVIQPVLSCLTFGENTRPNSFEVLDMMIAYAVGQYMMADGVGIARWREAQGRRNAALTVSMPTVQAVAQ